MLRAPVLVAAILAVVAAFAAPAIAQPTVGPAGMTFYTSPSPLPAGPPGDLISYRPTTLDLGPGAPAVDAWDVLYLSTDQVGAPDVVTGTVVVPSAAWSGSGQRPVVDYAFATQGLAQTCAPSLQLAAGTEYDAAGAVAALKRGWAVVATDYQGYTNGATPTYVQGLAEGHAVLDVLRAAEQIPGAGVASTAPDVIWGYSQGGGAAAWAGQIQRSYAPEMNLVGVAAGGVPADQAALEQFNNGAVGAGLLFYTLIGGQAAYPTLFHLDALFNAKGLALLPQIKSECAIQTLLSLQNQNIDQYMRVPIETLEADPIIRQFLDRQDLGASPIPVPVYQYAGRYDEFVALPQQVALKRAYCSQGVVDDFQLYPTEHLLTDPAAIGDVMDWIAARLAGGAAPSTCDIDEPLPSDARTTPEVGDLVVPFVNWQLSGSVTLAKLGLSMALPPGATFSGTADFTSGVFQGTTNIPPITTTMNIFGIPISATATFTPTGPLTGHVSLSPSGTLSISGGTSANLTLVSTSIGWLTIPIGCHTSSPVALSQDETVQLGRLSSAAFTSSGTTTFPSLTGCGFIGPLLSLLFSGPGNPYTLTTSPPPPIPF